MPLCWRAVIQLHATMAAEAQEIRGPLLPVSTRVGVS